MRTPPRLQHGNNTEIQIEFLALLIDLTGSRMITRQMLLPYLVERVLALAVSAAPHTLCQGPQ